MLILLPSVCVINQLCTVTLQQIESRLPLRLMKSDYSLFVQPRTNHTVEAKGNVCFDSYLVKEAS